VGLTSNPAALFDLHACVDQIVYRLRPGGACACDER